MKSRIIILVSVIILGLTACVENTPKNQDIHTHADGTTHEAVEIPIQESFTVEVDSLSNLEVAHDHEHSHSHDHDHSHQH